MRKNKRRAIAFLGNPAVESQISRVLSWILIELTGLPLHFK